MGNLIGATLGILWECAVMLASVITQGAGVLGSVGH